MADLMHPAPRTTDVRVRRPAAARRSRGARRFGYVVAVIVNLAMLYVAQHLLVWGWPAFLTPSFDELLPLVTLSFVAAIVVNAVYVVADPPWLRSLGSLVTSVIGVLVAVRTWQVFPFDFSGYATDWSGLVRVLLVVCVLGAGVGAVVELVRLVTWPLRAHDADREHEPSS